jgi:hypothetical protein
MRSNRREELVASAGDQALAAWLGRLQDGSFSRAGPALRTAYPPQRRMAGPQLAGYLERRTYALPSSTRPDGCAHAAPTLFSLYAEAFWLPTLGGAARLGNVRSHPWLALSILEGEHDTHAAVLTEGPAEVVGVCCVQRNRAVCQCGGSAGHMACASSVNAVARRSGGATSEASS